MTDDPSGEAAVSASVLRVRGSSVTSADDRVAVERPLTLAARLAGAERVVTTTMRTPGEDRALAVGFLFGEGVIAGAGDVLALESADTDRVVVELSPRAEAALAAAERRFVTSAACGVCGRAAIDPRGAISTPRPAAGAPRLDPAVVQGLPGALREAQPTFARTGGLHAAGLFTPEGRLLAAHEDVGRHNAVDKLVGTRLLARALPLAGLVLVVSGRASYELVQKAAAAGVPALVAVGAPSSLAIELAAGEAMTLLGFVRDGGFNVYTGGERVVVAGGEGGRPVP